ncbi:MAG: hypothetical protein IKT42_04610 [Clostridia bacterium]|nr:hypothetical protein [Clostridia bacterium]
MQAGIFTTCLTLVRKALKLLPKILELLASFSSGGVLSELLALAGIWAIVFFGIPIIETVIKIFAWFMRKFE